VILIVGSLGVILSIPGQTAGVSVYTDHLIKNLALSRVAISFAYLIGTLTSSLIMTWAGLLFDRYGARIVAGASALGLGLSLFLLSQSVDLSHWLAEITGLESSATAFGVLVIGFFGIRFFGQGVLTLVSRGMVMRWFEAHRGLAAAIMGVITSFGFAMAPPLLQSIISLAGWQESWMLIAGVMVVVVLPFILTFFRNSPEDCGLEVEEGLQKGNNKGNRQETEAKANPPASPSANQQRQRSYTLAEARKDGQLWFYLLILFFWAFYNTGFTFHIISIFETLGQGEAEALSIFFPIAVVAVGSSFLGNWLSDKMPMKVFFYAFLLGMIFSGLALLLPYNLGVRILLIGSMGVSSGLFSILSTVTWPKLYGREHLGAISGLGMAFMVAGSALGPLAFSLIEDWWGNYQHVGTLAMGFLALSGFSQSSGGAAF
jgi:OFA family oxalate/formate antiporter-like MFS transporter